MPIDPTNHDRPEATQPDPGLFDLDQRGAG